LVVALAFDFTHGFHDAANSIATVVSTRVLAPRPHVGAEPFVPQVDLDSASRRSGHDGHAEDQDGDH
jgi:PiT family inorganic phosphate transporter